MNKTDEVRKVRSGRQRIQKTTKRVVHLMQIGSVSNASLYPKAMLCKGEQFLVRKVNADIKLISFGMIMLGFNKRCQAIIYISAMVNI